MIQKRRYLLSVLCYIISSLITGLSIWITRPTLTLAPDPGAGGKEAGAELGICAAVTVPRH